MRIRDGDLSSPEAQALLADYFAFRVASFPVAGAYRVSSPDATQFDGVRGVFLLVEDDDGRAIGCGGIRMLDTDPGTPRISPALSPQAHRTPATVRAEVKHVWLGPAARGRGWAAELLRELEKRAGMLGATEMVLDTHDSLTSAARLYERLDYEPTAPYNDNPNATRWYRKALVSREHSA